MRRRIAGAFALVVRAGDDLARRPVDDDRSHRHVVVRERGARLRERDFHPAVDIRAGHRLSIDLRYVARIWLDPADCAPVPRLFTAATLNL